MRNEELTELLAPVIADLGLECLGVEYSPSHGNSLVRVYIEAADQAGHGRRLRSGQPPGFGVARRARPGTKGRYTLEVSSPGHRPAACTRRNSLRVSSVRRPSSK